MIEPLLADDALLADIAAARRRDGLHVWWLGQSGFLLMYQGRSVLLDPYLSDSLTQKYASTDKPHVRMTRRVVDPSLLNSVSVVTSSHNHTDHLDADTLRAVLAANDRVELLIPSANRSFVTTRLGIPEDAPVSVDAGHTANLHGFQFTGVAAAHETVERDAFDRCLYLGYVVRLGPWTVYHSGDTVLYDGIVDTLRAFNIDVALLPINGRAPERRVAGNLNGKEAAWLAKEIGAKLVIPCHYDMFEFNTADPGDEFIPECERLGQPYKVLRAGERWSSP